MAHAPAFISYCQKDAEWLEKVLPYFSVLDKQKQLKPWSDQELEPGDNWREEIEQAIDEAQIAILLVTQEFLVSEFIWQVEIPRFLEILEGKRSGKLRKIMPLILKPSTWEQFPEISERDVRPKGRRALSTLPDSEQLEELTEFSQAVGKELFSKPASPPSESQSDRTTTQAVIIGAGQATLEIRLSHCEWQNYRVEILYTWPGDREAEFVDNYSIRFDLQKLTLNDPKKYARQLGAMLFRPAKLQSTLDKIAEAPAQKVPLRIRICIDRSARELHSLRWETLTQLDDRLSEASVARYAVGRGPDWRPAYLRRWESTRKVLLVGIDPGSSSPTSGDNVQELLNEVRPTFGDRNITTKIIGEWLTVDGLAKALESHDGVDFIYLLIRRCESSKTGPIPCDLDRNAEVEARSGPEDEAAVTAGTKDAAEAAAKADADSIRCAIAEGFRAMERPPLLVVIAPPHEHSDDCWSWLPHVAHEVVAAGALGALTLQQHMDGDVWRDYLSHYVRTVIEDGRIDQSALTARKSLDGRSRTWQAVTMSRLRSGRLWYVPRFMDESRTTATWKDLIDQITEGHCTPIIGSGIDYRIARFRKEITRRWADRFQYPMGLHESANLPQVSQYIASTEKRHTLVRILKQDLVEYMRERYAQVLQGVPPEAPLNELLEKIVLDNPSEPHSILAELPFKTYVTANFSNFMGEALKRAEKEPAEAMFRSGESTRKRNAGKDAKHPLVYHLFGRIDYLESLVVTEDDYFEFLIDFWREREKLPTRLKTALASSSLLFLGFNLNHWDFRVLFRSLTKEESKNMRSLKVHVAVQVDPDDDLITDPDRAKEYLEKYFQDVASEVSIYWGSSQDFLRELKREWVAAQSRNPQGGSAP